MKMKYFNKAMLLLMLCVCAVLLTACADTAGGNSLQKTTDSKVEQSNSAGSKDEQNSPSESKNEQSVSSENKTSENEPAVSDASSEPSADESKTGTGKDTLVIYFSRTGNTEKIAEHLIDITNADSYVIEAAVPYTDDDIRYQDDNCRANQEQNDKTVRPEIANPIASIDSYDTIFLGYPIWWGQEPRIIDTFLESYDFSDKTVIPFCTSGSSGIETSERNISELVSIGNQLEGRRFSAGASKDEVKEWYDTLPLNVEKSDGKLKISVNGTELTATLEDNSSAQALTELLKQGSITVDMSDYGSFEKVGDLPQSLPTNDESITTVPGDIILYQGNKITIYYAENTWNFTKLGHIDDITQEELKKLLGDGNVTVTFSNK